MKNWNSLSASLGVLLLAAMPLLSQAKDASSAQPPQEKQTKKQTAPAAQPSDGQRVFEQNCSRCHNAPQGFSTRISGTIVRHMRVRANLSKQDQQALLRFFNP
jgi:cytochrome c2